MRVAIVNYGMGNLASVRRAFADLGADVAVADRPAEIANADRIVLPGVGAFADGMRALRDAGWTEALQTAVVERKTQLLGICLGMQMLASRSAEGGNTDGLNLIPGEVLRLDTLGCSLRIPHVGWNEVQFKMQDPLHDGIPDASDFYFVHSYGFVAESAAHLRATAPYGCDVAAIIRSGNVSGCQFHPEKSSRAGRRLLENFLSHDDC